MKFVLNFGYEAGGRERLNAVFFDLDNKVRNLRPLWRNYILPLMPEIIWKNFETYGARLGSPWPPLSPDYEKRKDRLYPGNPINVASGRMLTAATALNTPGNFVYWPTQEGGGGNPSFMIYGLDKTKFRNEYPKFIQDGTSKMPARPFIGLAQEDIEKITSLVLDWMQIRSMKGGNAPK